jgi:TonB-linked SusC/RagA family outer membrane protein
MKTMKKIFLLLVVVVITSMQIVFGQVGNPDFTVDGTVINAETGKPLAGASVTIEGNKPVITEDNGTFKLIIEKNNTAKSVKILQVSIPGYATRKYFLSGTKTLTVELYEEGYKGMEKNIQMPFGKESSLFTTFSTGSVKPDITSVTKPTPDDMLQGTVTGLNTVFRSGQPGSGSNMFLQGFNSLTSTSQPLVIVDGVPYENFGFKSLISNYQTNPLSAIEVKDIESITVLKDAAGLYGGKSSNGVILINTLKAVDATTRLEAYIHTGMSFIPKEFPVLDADRYKAYLGDLLSTSGLTSDQIQSLPYFNQNKPVADKYGRYSGNLDYYRYSNNSDWQKSVYEMSMDKNFYLNIKGGDQTAVYALSLGYLSKKGIMSNTSYDRFSMRFNSDINVSSKLIAHSNMSFSYGTRLLQDEGPASTTNLIYNGLTKSPFTSIYKYDYKGEQSPNIENPDAFGVSNVYALANNMVIRNLNYRFIGNISLDYTINKNWRLDGVFGIHFNKDRERIFIPSTGVAHDTLINAVITNESSHRVERWFDLYSDTYATYNKSLGDGSNLLVHAGVRYQNTQSENDYALAYNSSSDDFKAINYGDLNLRHIGGSLGTQNWMSIYTNADLLLKNKFIITAILASDASSRYNGMKLFPTLSGAWLLSSEKFMSGVDKVNFLKLRANVGLSGNDDIGNYSNRSYYTVQTFIGFNGLVLGGIPNKKLGPEMMQKANIGLDGSFLKERLQLSLDLYVHNVKDMITLSDAPSYSGFDYYLSNGGAMRNTGIDLSVSGRIVNKAVKWDLGLNVSTYKNEVTRLDCGTLESNINGAVIQTKVGQPIGAFLGYKTDGVYQYQSDAENEGQYIMQGAVKKYFTGGDIRFVDYTGEGKIDENDRVVIGDPNPDLFGSIISTVSYKTLALDVKLNYSVGGDVFNYTRYKLESMSGYENQSYAIQNRWRVDGQVTDMPKAVWGDPMGNSRFSDRWIEDGSYLRLKDITLSYGVPEKIEAIRSLKLFVTGENLLTFTNYMGADPEFSQSENPLYYGVDAVICPQPKALFFGVKIGL